MVIWLGNQQPLILNQDPWEFDDYKFCGRADLTFLICNVTSCDYAKYISYDLRGESPWSLVTTLSSLLVIGLVFWTGDKQFWFATWHLVTTWSRVIWICVWEPLILNDDYAKFHFYRSWRKGDINFLFCNVTPRSNMIKGKCDWFS